MSSKAPPNWAALEAKYKQDIESLTESAEMATIEKEIAEEKLDGCIRELQETKDKLAEATLQYEAIMRERDTEPIANISTSDSAVTVQQLKKVEEQNEVLRQALVMIRDMSAKDKKALEDIKIEHEEIQIKLLHLEEKEQKYLEQIKIYEEQIDVGQSAQEMVEKLTQQKTELEDKLTEMIEDLDCMEKLRDMNEELLESARQNEIDLTEEVDKLRLQCKELTKKRHDMEDYLTDQEKTLAKLREESRTLNEELTRLKNQFKDNESIEQQKHQIENVAYKINFSETKMAEKEAEIVKYKRNLTEMEEQMNNLSLITKEQSTRLDELKLQYDTKVSENAELQRALKKKMEEVSELEIRREMAEKKLQSVQKDKESKIVSLTRQIETMKGIEIQHEEDMKRLMEDNEIIEKERRELRDQLNRSNRSLDRNLQTSNISMVTAQDISLASLGITLQNPPSIQASPVHQPTQISSALQNQQIATAPASFTGPNTSLGDVNTSIGPLGVHRRLFATHASGADDASSLKRIRGLGEAFDQMARKNHELEIKLALHELDSRVPPYDDTIQLSDYYDIDKAKSLRVEVDKLKREIRSSIINQRICTKSRNVNAQLRDRNFTLSRLAFKCQALDSKASSILSNSNLSCPRTERPLLQSTPVK